MIFRRKQSCLHKPKEFLKNPFRSMLQTGYFTNESMKAYQLPCKPGKCMLLIKWTLANLSSSQLFYTTVAYSLSFLLLFIPLYYIFFMNGYFISSISPIKLLLLLKQHFMYIFPSGHIYISIYLASKKYFFFISIDSKV